MTFIKNASSLPPPSLVDVIITDHRATVALLDLFSEVRHLSRWAAAWLLDVSAAIGT